MSYSRIIENEHNPKKFPLGKPSWYWCMMGTPCIFHFSEVSEVIDLTGDSDDDDDDTEDDDQDTTDDE